jgi:hypothetical protein
MKHSAGLAVLAAVLAVGACGGSDEGSGGVTQEESQQLNDAANMIDVAPDSLAAPENTDLGNGEAGSGGEDANASTGDLPVSDAPPSNAQ